MPISFAGVGLTPPSDAEYLVGRYWHHNQIDEFDHQAYFEQIVSHLPTPYIPNRGPPRIGVLSWPTDADKFSTCWLIASFSQLAEVRSSLGSNSSGTLLITDGIGGQVQAEMHLLPPRPISQGKTSGEELYLLTLVDDRFYWYQAGSIGTPETNSWDDLFQFLFEAIGVAASIDTVPAAYLEPNPKRWEVDNPSVPIMLQAACVQCGLRLVRDTDGTVSLQNYTTASGTDTGRWGVIQELVYNGGRILNTDIGRCTPESVDVQFFDGNITNKTLTTLALPDYGGASGVTTRKAQIVADPDELESAQREDYATQAATDYYNWFLALTDCTLRGIVSVPISGLDERVEWVHHTSGIVTRIIRPQWGDRNIYGTRPSPVTGEGSGSGSGSGGCVEPFLAVDVECLRGERILHSKRFAVGTNAENQLVITECSEEDFGLGPCSPTNPTGTKVPVVVNLCLETTTLQYKDHAGVNRTLAVVTGMMLERRLVTVPIVENIRGCLEPSSNCCDSGSGSGDCCDGSVECVLECPQCASMSSQWEFTSPYSDLDSVLLCAVIEPDDGNFCQFISCDLVWRMYYDFEDEVWILVNNDTGDIWFRSGVFFGCGDPNSFLPLIPIVDNILVSPVFTCITFDCVDNECVEVFGPEGEFASRPECNAVCGGSGSGSGSGGGGTIDVSCGGCTVVYRCYEFIIAGITDGTCAECNVLNGIHNLYYDGTEGFSWCRWRDTYRDMCGLIPFFYLNRRQDEGKWVLTLANLSSGAPRWEAPLSDCLNTPLVLSLVVNDTTTCLNLPSAITLTPATCL